MSNDSWTKLYVVRHGETRWNAEGRWQGWKDSDLTPKGIEQAARAAHQLYGCGAAALFCSDAGRAIVTAHIIGKAISVQPKIDSALRERFYGEFEGLTSDEIDEKFPDTRYEVGRDRRETWRPVGGESLVEVTARVMQFIRLVAQEYAGQGVVLVTHGGVLRCLDAVASHQSLEETWDRVPANCCIFELEANLQGDLRIVKHFAPLESAEEA